MKRFSFKEAAPTEFTFYHQPLATGGDHPPAGRRSQWVLTSAGLSSWTAGRCHWLPPSPGGSPPRRGCGSHGNRWVCVHTSGWSLQLLGRSDCKCTWKVEAVEELLLGVFWIRGSERVEFQEPHLFTESQSYDLNLINKNFYRNKNISKPLQKKS